MPPRRVDEEVRVIRRDSPDPAQVADRRVGEDDPRVREAAGERDRVAREGRDPAAGVHEHGQPPLVCEREQRLDLRVRELEALRPRVELDPARTGVDAAASPRPPRPASGRSGRRRRGDRRRPRPRRGSGRSRAGYPSGSCIGMTTPRASAAVERGDELVAGEREAVRVVEADVAMDVEERRSRRRARRIACSYQGRITSSS